MDPTGKVNGETCSSVQKEGEDDTPTVTPAVETPENTELKRCNAKTKYFKPFV